MSQPENPVGAFDTSNERAKSSQDLVLINEEIKFATPPSRNEILAKHHEAKAVFDNLIRPYLETPKLAVDKLSELIIDLSLARTSELELCQCLSRLREFRLIADGLKVRFPNIPLDLTQLGSLYETIMDFTQGDWSDYEKCDPRWEEAIDGSVESLQHSLPALHLWAYGAQLDADPWSRPLKKNDWKTLHKSFTDNLWRKIVEMNGKGGVDGNVKTRGPWRIRESVCLNFGFKFPGPGQ